jgi:hypothetical protein
MKEYILDKTDMARNNELNNYLDSLDVEECELCHIEIRHSKKEVNDIYSHMEQKSFIACDSCKEIKEQENESFIEESENDLKAWKEDLEKTNTIIIELYSLYLEMQKETELIPEQFIRIRIAGVEARKEQIEKYINNIESYLKDEK